MFSRLFAVFFLLPIFSLHASPDQLGDTQRAQLIEQLNGQFDCKIMMFNSLEQVTYAREISLPDCKPSSGENYVKASQLLTQLAELSVPVDAEVLREQALSLDEVGRQAKILAEIRAKLLAEGIIQMDDGEIRVDRIGHPFQRADLNATRWFEAYVTAVRKMSEDLDGCVAPICDPELFRVAEAVTARPPLDTIYYADQKRPVAPHPYALSYFSQRYSGDSKIRRALGLDGDKSWPWGVDNYVSHITESGDLVFTELFTPDSYIYLSVAGWQNHKEFPFVVPLFMLFQEGSEVLDLVRSVKNNYVVDHLREIRFEPAQENGPMLSLGNLPGGEYVLRIHVLSSSDDVSVDSIRALLMSRIPAFLKTTAQVAHQE